MGDLNVNFLKQENKELKAMMDVFGFKQMAKKPTRIPETTPTLIEILLTSDPANMIEIDVIPNSIGDLDMAGCVGKLNHAHFKPRDIICCDDGSYTSEAMIEELESVDWSTFYSCVNVNEAWSIMTNILLAIFENYVPNICK